MVAEGFTNQQVVDGLNRLGTKTPSGKQYYAELAGATWSKLRRRNSGKSSSDPRLVNTALYISEEPMRQHMSSPLQTSTAPRP
jgi:hypothetical protein